MSIEITRTKIVLPPVRKDLFSRPRLIDLLYDQLDYRLILVIAQAGYGKTSLLVDFAHQVEMPVCWCSLDELDQDPQRFYAHFISAIQVRYPSFGASSLAALEATFATQSNLSQLVTSIVNDAYDHIQEHYVIILDDFHLVNEQEEILSFINRFVHHTSDNCHLILSSRVLLPIPDMDLFVARSLVGGLGYEELAFLADEIQSLILQNYHLTLSDKNAAELANQTEGWITGLLLSAQTALSGMTSQLKAARLSGVDLYGYLARQVLLQQEPFIQDFLLKSAYLDEFNAEICQTLWGTANDWNAIINIILARNLFVQPVGEGGQWFRYHHLFQEFLQNRFAQEHPEQVTVLLEQIARIYEDREEWERAYAIRKQLKDPIRLADLVEQAGSSLVKNMRFSTLSGWLDALPNNMIASRPRLISLKGTALYFAGQIDDCLLFLDRAEASLRVSGDQPALARTLTRRATALTTRGSYQKSIHDSKEALDIAAQDANLIPVYAEALRTIGMNQYHLGHLEEAIDYLTRSLKKYTELGDLANVANVNMELGMCNRVSGNYTRALVNYEKSLAYWRQVNDTTHQAQVLNNMGVLYYQSGNYIQAGKVYDEALVHTRRANFIRLEAYLLCSMGDLYMELDAYESASVAFDKAHEIALKTNDRFLTIYSLLAKASLAQWKKDFTQAYQLLDQTHQLIGESYSDYEMGLYDLKKGQILLAEGVYLKASEVLYAATDLFTRGGQKGDFVSASLLLANANFLCSDLALAQTNLMKAFNQAQSLVNPHRLVVTGREVKSLLKTYNNNPDLSLKVLTLLEQVDQFEKEIPSLRRRLRPFTSSVLFIAPTLSIYTLGKILVEINGIPLASYQWSAQPLVREFFLLLLNSQSGISKDEIALTLWPDSTPRQLKMRFKNTMYKLRYVLGQDVITYEENLYHFNQSLDYEYDVEEFTRYIQFAQTAQNEMDKFSQYKKAFDIYLGHFFPEGQGTWVIVTRYKLANLFEEAGLYLAQNSLETKNYQLALSYSLRLIQENHCLEEAHRIAMRSYAGLGDRPGVTLQYEACQKFFRDELGASPSSQTVRLYKILSR